MIFLSLATILLVIMTRSRSKYTAFGDHLNSLSPLKVEDIYLDVHYAEYTPRDDDSESCSPGIALRHQNFPCEYTDIKMTDEISTVCLTFGLNAMTRQDHSEMCRSQETRAYLAVVRTLRMKNFITSLLIDGGSYWIGAKIYEESSIYFWEDSSILEHQEWIKNTDEECVYLNRDGWWSADCTEQFKAICMYIPDVKGRKIRLSTHPSYLNANVGNEVDMYCEAVHKANTKVSVEFTYKDASKEAKFWSDGVKDEKGLVMDSMFSEADFFAVDRVCYRKTWFMLSLTALLEHDEMQGKCCQSPTECYEFPKMTVQYATSVPEMTVIPAGDPILLFPDEVMLCNCYVTLGLATEMTVTLQTNKPPNSIWSGHIHADGTVRVDGLLPKGTIMLPMTAHMQEDAIGGNAVNVTLRMKADLSLNDTVCVCQSFNSDIPPSNAKELTATSSTLLVIPWSMLPHLYVHFHHYPSTVCGSQWLVATCRASLDDSTYMAWHLQPPGQRLRRWFIRLGLSKHTQIAQGLNITYREETNEQGEGTGNAQWRTVPIISTFSILATYALSRNILSCTVLRYAVPHSILIDQSLPIIVMYPSRRPQMEVRFHAAPNIVHDNSFLRADCSAWVGTGGNLKWTISNIDKNFEASWIDELHDEYYASPEGGMLYVQHTEFNKLGGILNPKISSTVILIVNHSLQGSRIICSAVNIYTAESLQDATEKRITSDLITVISSPRLTVKYHASGNTVFGSQELEAICEGTVGANDSLVWHLDTLGETTPAWTLRMGQPASELPLGVRMIMTRCYDEEHINMCKASKLGIMVDSNLNGSRLRCVIELAPSMEPEGYTSTARSGFIVVKYKFHPPVMKAQYSIESGEEIVLASCSAYIGTKGVMTWTFRRKGDLEENPVYVDLEQHVLQRAQVNSLSVSKALVSHDKDLGPTLTVLVVVEITPRTEGVLTCYSYNISEKTSKKDAIDIKKKCSKTFYVKPYLDDYGYYLNVRLMLVVLLLTVVLIGLIAAPPPASRPHLHKRGKDFMDSTPASMGNSMNMPNESFNINSSGWREISQISIPAEDRLSIPSQRSYRITTPGSYNEASKHAANVTRQSGNGGIASRVVMPNSFRAGLTPSRNIDLASPMSLVNRRGGSMDAFAESIGTYVQNRAVSVRAGRSDPQ